VPEPFSARRLDWFGLRSTGFRAGDTVVVTAIDRLGRSVAEVTRTIAELGERRILLRALREGVDTATPTGRAIAAIMLGGEVLLIGGTACVPDEKRRHGAPPMGGPATTARRLRQRPKPLSVRHSDHVASQSDPLAGLRKQSVSFSCDGDRYHCGGAWSGVAGCFLDELHARGQAEFV
jgi:Resolvase, N terminal domain